MHTRLGMYQRPAWATDGAGAALCRRYSRLQSGSQLPGPSSTTAGSPTPSSTGGELGHGLSSFQCQGAGNPQLCLPATWPYPGHSGQGKVPTQSQLPERDHLGGAQQQNVLQSEQDSRTLRCYLYQENCVQSIRQAHPRVCLSSLGTHPAPPTHRRTDNIAGIQRRVACSVLNRFQTTSRVSLTLEQTKYL